MKKYGTLIALAVAVVFGIAAVLLANQWLSKRTIEETVVIKEQMPLTKIVIAGKDLEMGTLLSKENTLLADWPKANVPTGAFTSVEEIAGRVVVSKISAGLPLIAAEMAAPGSGIGLVAIIEPGMRAMSIRVDEVIGVSGFVLPNTFVDILHFENRQVETILKRIKVLAIAQQTFVEEGKATVVRTVTLELDPKQAEKLVMKTNTGAINLTLRNPAEDELELPKPKPEPVKVATGKRAYKPRPQPQTVPTYDITVIRGTRSVETVKLKESVN